MADDDPTTSKRLVHHQHHHTQRPPQETPSSSSGRTGHQPRQQEAQGELKFPSHPTGIVALPPGSRGPKSLYLKRNGDNFGFTLRHFIVYPPDSVSDYDGRHAFVGALSAPMDTIFVKSVKKRSPAELAGLQCGDRLVGVNRVAVTDKSYAEVVQLIQHSPDYLHLLVVPKEEDVLQRFFAETAYNPASNVDRHEAQRFLTQTFNHRGFQVDANSWRSLQGDNPIHHNQRSYPLANQKSVESLDTSLDRNTNRSKALNESLHRREKSRAQPQVPFTTLSGSKMGRRASDGCALSEQHFNSYHNPYDQNQQRHLDYRGAGEADMMTMTMAMKTGDSTSYNPGCRLSLDSGARRESASSSLSSTSNVDGSKDSLSSSSFGGSNSTLTGHETDDSVLGYRKRYQQKEEFLKTMAPPTDGGPPDTSVIQQREFYGRPKKLDSRSVWPPSPPPPNAKPTHQNFQRVKNDIENERDLLPQKVVDDRKVASSGGGVFSYDGDERKVKEGAVAPLTLNLDYVNSLGYEEDDVFMDDRRLYSPTLQTVHKRARQFEAGKPLPEDDPILGNRTSFYRSELARLSSKRAVPNVTERAQEFEERSEPRRDTSGSSVSVATVQRRVQRDSRSLESSGSSSSSTAVENSLFLAAEDDGDEDIETDRGAVMTPGVRLSGNVTISSGSKFIHCPPPSEQGRSTVAGESPNLENRILRPARSNSEESWATARGDDEDLNKTLTPTTPPTAVNKIRLSRHDDPTISKGDQDVMMDIPYADLPPSSLIPEPVELMHIAPLSPPVNSSPAPPLSVTLTAPPGDHGKLRTGQVQRPNQLDLRGSGRHLKPPPGVTVIGEYDGDNNKPIVVKRRTKNTNLADDERTVRRESYLKATETGRMHFDSDLSDGDLSPQALRSGSLSENSNSSASLDREKTSANPLPSSSHLQHYPQLLVIIKEGTLHCKIMEIDGKRFGDRSWKPVFASLRGPKLFLYKDRHHQSPSDSVENSLASGVDMRASVVRVAEDYTKRKHVLRVSSVNPCRSELLLQADSTEELADWVKALQEQMATTTELEANSSVLHNNNTAGHKQQAVPQLTPASTTIQVQGSRLSPQPTAKSAKSSGSRNRSPTGQSPVSKSRKPSTQVSSLVDPSTSPKSKTWRGRVAKQFRRMHGASSPSSPTAPEGSTFGIPLDQCLMSHTNPYVPRFVEVCTNIVDANGLHTVGIYRVPGNNASITALSEEVDRNYDDIPLEDPRWNDLHVVSSLLKSYFRKIPDSLVTNVLYGSFINADKIEDPETRMRELRRLVKGLPPYNYQTLKHIVFHLRKVVDHCEFNKMEAKNLAIVFGPNIVRCEELETMVSNMTHQCKIVETLLTCPDWFFGDDDSDDLPVPAIVTEICEDSEPANTQALLLDNLSKYEALKDKEKNGALFSSIISAAQRKVKRKTTKGTGGATSDSKDDVCAGGQFLLNDLKHSTSTTDGKTTTVIPTTVTDIEKITKLQKQPEKMPWFNYSTDKEEFHRRIENFRQETEAMLHMPRTVEISAVGGGSKSSSMSNVDNCQNQNLNNNNHNGTATTRLTKTSGGDSAMMLKTHSASNVFSRTSLNPSNNNNNSINKNSGTNRNSMSSVDNSAFSVQYKKGGGAKKGFSDRPENGQGGKYVLRRGSSVENVNSTGASGQDVNGALKKVKYENEGRENQQSGSLDSLTKIASLDDDTDLVTSLTKIYDKKLQEEKHLESLLLTTGEGLPFVDDSPEKVPRDLTPVSALDGRCKNLPLDDLYRNPSLHKSPTVTANNKKEGNDDEEKDIDSTIGDNKSSNKLFIPANKITLSVSLTSAGASKLRRSESLNKPDKISNSTMIKLTRSESLNKTSDKVKRSDSLTKNEKTESNLNKRRELVSNNNPVSRRKDSKLKRKNGMPDRSIKRRHTVGGTKDPDKVTWLDNKYHHEQVSQDKENNKEKSLRTSSPDLSSARRDKLFLEINLIGPENVMMALRQNVIGGRPQSYPLPLESHV